MHVNLSGETTGYYADFDSLAVLAKVLEHGFLHDGSYSSFRGRHHGRPIRHDLAHPSALVVCLQNHDQIGNRATGDRLTASLSYGKLAIGAVLTMTSPFTPMLFMGEEFAACTPWQFFTSHPEPELGKATAEGRIKEFERMGWDPAVVPDPQDPETFQRSKLKWDEAGDGEHARLAAAVQGFGTAAPQYSGVGGLRLRRRHPLSSTTTNTGCSSPAAPSGWCATSRTKLWRTPLSGSVLLATDDEAALEDGTLTLPGGSAAVVRVH